MIALPRSNALPSAQGQPDTAGRKKTAGRPDRLSSLDLSVLFYLAWHGGTCDSLREMASHLQTDYSSLSVKIRRLEQLGLLEIERAGRGRSSKIKTAKNGNPI